MKRQRVIRLINIALLLIGAFALYWMMRRLGTAEVVATLSSARAWAIPIIATSVAIVFLNAAAIHVFMRPEQRMISYWRVFAAQISGQAVNSVTPTGTLGEVVKATMLVGHAPRYRAVSSIVTYNLAYFLVQCFILLFAIAVSLLLADFPPRIDWTLRLAFLALATITGLALYATRFGFVRTFANLARRLSIISPERRERVATKLAQFDDQLRIFGPNRQASYTAGFFFNALAQLLAWFELWLVLRAIGADQGLVFVITASAAGTIISKIASIVPLGIGAAEGGLAGLFELLGPGAFVGLSVSLVTRLRTVLIAGIGLLIMLGVQLADHLLYRRSRRRLLSRSETPS